MICNKCKQDKAVSDFGSNKKRCKQCIASYMVEYNHRRGKSKTYAGQPRRNLISNKIGLLTVLEDCGIKNGHRFWLCECECGNKKEIMHTHLANSKQQSCGCLHKRTGHANPCWKGHGEISGDIWWNIRKKSIRPNRKNLKFSLTIDQAWNLFQTQKALCNLTGIPLTFGKGAKGIGRTASLDRIDSRQGYVIDNVQWVHKDINWMKNTFTQAHFIEMCKKVAERASQ